MARLRSIGFESNSLTNGVEFEDTFGSPTISSTTVRSGYFSGRTLNATINTPKGFHAQVVASDNTGDYYVRVYLLIHTLPNAITTIISLLNVATNQPVSVMLTTGGALRLTINDIATQVGSDSSALNLDQWYKVEVRMNKTGGAGASIASARIDDVDFASASNLTITNSFAGIYVGVNLEGDAATTCDLYFDDIAVNDTAGSSQTSYPGNGKITHFHPSAAGDQTQMTATGAGTNWLCVSEITPNDVSTYVTNSADLQIDTYNIDDPKLLVGRTPTITLVQLGMRFATNNGGSSLNFTPRIMKASGGTVSEGTVIATASAAYLTNNSAAPNNPPLTLYQDPDGANWTVNTLNSAQIGIKMGKVGAVVGRCSAVWLIVEYTTESSVGIITNNLRPRAFAPGLAR